jgi:hypothetical protein
MAKLTLQVCMSQLIIIQIYFFKDSFYLLYTIWDGLSRKTISRYCPFNTKLAISYVSM